MHHRPERKAARGVLLHAKIDGHVLDTGADGRRRDLRQVGCPEIAAELIIKVHFGRLQFRRRARSIDCLQGHPDIDRGNELPRRRLADIHPLRGDKLTGGEIETCPWLGHAAKGHFLDRAAGGGVHDRGDDRHDAP